MTLLNHIGVFVFICLGMIAIYFYCKLANYLTGSIVFKLKYIDLIKFTLIVYPIYEAFYWTFKIFF